MFSPKTEEKFKHLLYKWELHAEFEGSKRSAFPTFSQEAGEKVHTEMPPFRGHFQMVGEKPTSVLDGWADRPPLSATGSGRVTVPVAKFAQAGIYSLSASYAGASTVSTSVSKPVQVTVR